MSEAISTTYDPHGHRPHIGSAAIEPDRNRTPAPTPLTRRAALGDAGQTGAFIPAAARWQVREESPPYEIPDIEADEPGGFDYELHEAASDHARHLHKAQRDLDKAQNLVGVLRASLETEGDSRAMQTDAVLEIVERRIRKAHERLDRHESRHTNLFFAYFDLARTETDGESSIGDPSRN